MQYRFLQRRLANIVNRAAWTDGDTMSISASCFCLEAVAAPGISGGKSAAIHKPELQY